MTGRRCLRRLPLLVLLVVAGLVPARAADAHTALSGSAPSAGATVPATTDRMVLSFTDEVRVDFARVQVTGPDGASAGGGAVSGSGTDVVQPLRAPLAPGQWTAAYRVLSPDGHPISGTITFTVAPAPTTATPAPTTATPGAPAAGPSPTAAKAAASPSSAPLADAEPAADSGSATVPVALGALVLVAAAGAGAVVARRRSRSAGPTAGG